jgi:ABC-type multidrug transport system fused ATPase/permease subunit
LIFVSQTNQQQELSMSLFQLGLFRIATRSPFLNQKAHERLQNFVARSKEFWEIWGSYTRPLIILALLSLTIELMSLVFPFVISRIARTFEQGTVNEAYGFAVILVLINFAKQLIGKIHWNQYFNRVAAPINAQARLVAMEKTEQKPLSYIDSKADKIGLIIQKGVEGVENCLNDLCVIFMPMFIYLGLCLIGIKLISLKAAFIALICFFLYFSISIMVSLYFLPKIKELSKIEDKLDERFYERLWNMVLTVMSNEVYAERLKQISEIKQCNTTAMSLWNGYQWRMAMVREPVAALCFLGLILASINMVFDKELSVANFMLLMWWASGAFAAMAATTASQRGFLEHWGHVIKFLNYLDTELPVVHKRALVTHPRFESLQFREVEYKHVSEEHAVDTGETWSLQNISFTINRGEFAAIVGSSGSGKSTLIELIRGSPAPRSGIIFVNDIPLPHTDLPWWWKQIGYVPQKPKLWNVSMRENILFGNRKATEEQLVAAMKAARLYEDFYLTGKMTRSIGNDGCELSGGEKQRVAIARALLGNPSVILLDEAMTGLDSVNEYKVLDALLDLAKELDESGKRKYTLVVIAHNLTTASPADKVLVMDKGKLVACGKHIDLIVSCPEYGKLAQAGLAKFRED